MSLIQTAKNHFGIEVANALQWDQWEPGGEYTKQIILKNVNLKTKKLQYRIPNRRFFTTRYPQPIVLSSGASIKLPITFRPIEKNLHEDVIEFITKEGEFKVPMKAILPEAQLRLPNTIKFGMCAVKDIVKMSFQIVNTSDSNTVFQMVCSGPFTLTPSTGTLAPRTQCEITAQFKPQDAFVYSVDALCLFGKDSNERKKMTIELEGIGKYPYLGIRHKGNLGNNVQLNFGDVSVRQQMEKSIELINYTPVDAPFQILQKSRGVIIDNTFSCSHYHGIIPAESTLKITIYFQPENTGMEYIDEFEILSVGLTSRSLLKCQGKGVGPVVQIETTTINFNTTSPGMVVTRSFKVTNHSNIAAIFQFQIDHQCSVFKLDTLSGIINANSTKTIILQFAPTKPIVYFRRIFCLVHNQGAISLDVCGTCCTGAEKPAILTKQHLENYEYHSRSGITRLSPDQILDFLEKGSIVVNNDTDLMDVNDATLATSLVKSPLPLCTMHEYFNHSFSQELESVMPHVSLDSKHIDFGMCRENNNFQKTINVNNHTLGKVSCSWMNLDKNIFVVVPSDADIEPLSSVSFMISFRSFFFSSPTYQHDYSKQGQHVMNGPARFYCSELEAYISYKSMRDHRIIDERTITRPWCLTLTVSAHTFPKHAEKFTPVCKWEKTKLIFPPVTSSTNTVYRTCVLQNNGDNPIFYDFNDDTEHVFSCKPSTALVESRYQVIAFQMAPSCDENCTKNVICNINDDLKYSQNFECITTNEKPLVSLVPNDFVYFKPTCIGDSSKQTVSIKNTSRLTLNLKWKIASSDAAMLKVYPVSCSILPNETQKHEWLFTPSATVKHLFKVKLLVTAENEHHKKYELRFIGEGQHGSITCKKTDIHFEDILVGCEETRSVSLRNDSDCSLSFQLIVEESSKKDESNNVHKTKAIEETALSAECEYCVVPAHSKVKMKLCAKPMTASTYIYHVYYILKSKMERDSTTTEVKGRLCKVTIQGTYPSLLATDVYGFGCVENFSKSFLWQLFRLDHLNTLLKTDPESQELKYGIASRHSTRRRMPNTTSAINHFDFGSSAVGSDPCIISVNFQNIGSSPLEWVIRYPTDMQLDMEFWAENGKLEDDEVHEMYIMANELFSIEPRHGQIPAGQHQIIDFTYRHTSSGVHQLPLLFKIVQGREIRFNLFGHTLENSTQRLHFTSYQHIFSPVSIGQTSSMVQTYMLCNTSDQPVKFTFDTQPLQQLNSNNFDWPILQCLTPAGEIQPRDFFLTHWSFSPLEARSYTIDLSLLIDDGDNIVLRFSGSGYDPNHMCMIPIKSNKDVTSRIANEKQLVLLSTDHLYFKDIPLFCEEQQIIFLTNSSPDHTMSFYWDSKDTPCENVVSITPNFGYLQPGKSVVCKVKVFSYGPVSLHDFDIICKVTDETEMSLYEENLKQWHIKQEQKKVLFTITDKPERKKKNITRNKTNRSPCSPNSLQRYNALPPIKSKTKSINSVNTLRKSNQNEVDDAETENDPMPLKPRFFVLHLGVTVKTCAVKDWLKDNTASRDEVFILRYPLDDVESKKQFDNCRMHCEELNTIQLVTQCMIKDILLDAEFMFALETIEDEAIPYYQMITHRSCDMNLTSEKSLVKSDETLTNISQETERMSDNLTEKSKSHGVTVFGKEESMSKEAHSDIKTDHVTQPTRSGNLMGKRQMLKRSDEARFLLENILENTILNILSEDISLTQRGRMLTKPDNNDT